MLNKQLKLFFSFKPSLHIFIIVSINKYMISFKKPEFNFQVQFLVQPVSANLNTSFGVL